MAGVGLSQEWLNALSRYAEGLAVETARAAAAASGHLHSRVVERISEDPNWAGLETNVQTWSEDGKLIIGIHGNLMASQAFALEYGDETRPPSPIFRSLGSELAEAGEVFDNHMMMAGVAR